MISAAYVRTLFEYNRWATARVLDTAEQLTPAQLETQVLEGLPPLLPTLAHTLGAELIWRLRWEGSSPTGMLGTVELPTLAAIRERWTREADALQARLAALDDAALTETINYRTFNGRPHQSQLWEMLAHLANHSTHHRSEAAAMLTALGHSPGDIDMLVYFRRRGATS